MFAEINVAVVDLAAVASCFGRWWCGVDVVGGGSVVLEVVWHVILNPVKI